MKKTIAIAMGIFALTLVVVPAMAKGRPSGPPISPPQSEPENTLVNTVMVNNMSVSLANSGLNRQRDGGELRTGAAYSDSMNTTQVSVGVLGCCEEDEPSCCQRDRNRCGCGDQQEESGSPIMNMVSVNNGSLALANSGLNSQSGSPVVQKPCRRTPPMQSGGLLVTGRADAYSTNETLVNVAVSGMN